MSNPSKSEHRSGLEVAIIGMVCRFPGAGNIDAFWQNLRSGVESISFFSDEALISSGISSSLIKEPNYVKAGAILEDAELFDASFFGFSPKEAEIMDPQHRIFLECAWEALENAGYNSEAYEGLIGVYGGANISTYLLNLYSNPEFVGSVGSLQTLIGNDKDYLASRVSYKLNLEGPSINVQSACSTSLLAVHLACQGLLSGECDLALAGGVSLRLPQKAGYIYRQGGILSPDGHCRAFDAKAQGAVFGSGVGIVVLKRLGDALADEDRICAVIKGSAANNDGSSKVGYTAPSIHGQSKVIRAAQLIADVAPETITYVETHGTGTPMGDPIEIAALTKAFRASTGKERFCALGAVKTNVGHLESAAGIAGLIKTVLAMQHRQLPPSLHFKEPNPEIDFVNSPFYVNTELTEWRTEQQPRRAGLSSFGIGGTNVHVILEEAPTMENSGESRPWQLLLLSARTSAALEIATDNLIAYLKKHPYEKLADIAFTYSIGRRDFKHRRILICRDIEDAVTALENRAPESVKSNVHEASDRPIAFMFSGFGDYYVNMGFGLYQTEPTFRQQVDFCAEFLKPHLGLDLRDVMYPGQRQADEAAQRLSQTFLTQPAMFVFGYALAQLWMEWGVRPQAMIGYGIGEYVAACLAGVFSLEDALLLVAKQAQMIQQLPSSAMLAVYLSKEEVQPLLGEDLSLSAVNGPSLCVLAGPTEAVESLQSQLSERGVICRRLQNSHGFHYKMMQPISQNFTKVVNVVSLNPPQIPYISNVTGTWITAEEATASSYWAKHLCQTVRFADGFYQLQAEPRRILLEVGPSNTLCIGTQFLSKDAVNDRILLSSIYPDQEQQHDAASVLKTLGQLWLSGIQINWSRFYSHERRHRLPLPTYPFERQRFWIEPYKQPEDKITHQFSLSKNPNLADWFYVPLWRELIPLVPAEAENLTEEDTYWLLFADTCGVGTRIAERLQQAKQNIVLIKVGLQFEKVSDQVYTINPQQPDDYVTVIKAVQAMGKPLRQIVHLWNVTPENEISSELDLSINQQPVIFYSLLFLAQALGNQQIAERAQIAVISNQMQEVTGEEMLCPEKAVILGLCKVIPQEYANLSCCSIDIILPKPGTSSEERLIDHLIAELTAKTSDLVIAYRRSRRWARTFEALHLEGKSLQTSRLRDAGVYLITGGLGGIGLVVAEHLAQSVRQAKLVLVGRSVFPAREEWERWLSTHEAQDRVSRKIKKLQALENLGTEILVVSANVAELEQMQTAVTQALERFGTIHGVIHAAGIAGGGLIQLKTREEAERVLAPKIKGTRVLATVLEKLPLDFFVLFSSTISIIGGIGQVDYCAANAFLDAFARYNMAKTGIFTIAINWDGWQEVGMAAEASTAAGIRGSAEPYRYKEVDHPLLDFYISETLIELVYLTELSVQTHWILSEHRLMGTPVVPATAYLEMVRAAFMEQVGSGGVEIEKVLFQAPLVVGEDDKKELRTFLEKNGEKYRFRILSKSSSRGSDSLEWQEHAIGMVGGLEPKPMRRHEIGEIVKRCNIKQIRLNNKIEKEEERLVYWGPRWKVLEEVYVGEAEALGLLKLPDEFSDDLHQLKLHPSLLDVATSLAVLFTDEEKYLPIAYGKLSIYNDLTGEIYCYLKYKSINSPSQEIIKTDVIIMDREGVEILEVQDFALKKVDKSAVLNILHKSVRPKIDNEQSILTEREKTFESSFGLRAINQESLEDGLLPPEGVEAFRRILSEVSVPQIVVCTKDLQSVMERAKAFTQSSILKEMERMDASETKHPQPNVKTPYITSRDELERCIADTWQRMLGIEVIGIHDDFFELGGDSLLAVESLAVLNEIFQVELPLQSLIDNPTVASLAMAILYEQAEQFNSESLIQALAEIKELSEEEVQQILATENRLSDEEEC